MNILILGGNRFFGNKLAQKLVANGDDVTLLNRGNTDDQLGNSVQRICCDRGDAKKLSQALEGKSYDVVYDQICYDYNTAKQACEVFKNKTDRYIFTSSQSVYEPGQAIKEKSFDPKTHKIDKEETSESSYAEAKRQAEVGFEKFAPFDICSIRFPIVVGHDDYTKRFDFHRDRIKSGEPIYFPNKEARISFVTSDFAGEVLFKLARLDFTGPLNVASPSPIKLSRFVEIIENHFGKNCVYASEANETNHSPYGISKDWYMNCDRLKDLGLIGEEIETWLPEMLSSAD